MNESISSRARIAMGLGAAVILVHLAGFATIGVFAWRQFVSPSSTVLKVPILYEAQVFRGELVFPMTGVVPTGTMIKSGRMICLRAVDLQTGRFRDIETPNASEPGGLISNGERLWCCGRNEIYEFDGQKFAPIPSKQKLGPRISWPFIYENHLALIDQDLDRNNRLQVLVDGEWQMKGRVALPGRDRTWVVDDATGTEVLVPRTSDSSVVSKSMDVQVRVVPAGGKFHLFQSDIRNYLMGDIDLCYRVGFDFVTKPMAGEPVSALSPENSIADTTGWVRLDRNLAGTFLHSAVLDDEWLWVRGNEICRPVRPASPTDSITFECIAEVKKQGMLMLSLASSEDGRHVYALANNFVDDTDVYRLDDRGLQKLPYTIPGMGSPLERWVATVFWQVMAVVAFGNLLLCVLAAFRMGPSAYAYGQGSATLASLFRRVLARSVDLLLTLAPLMVQFVWQFRHAYGSSIIKVLESEDLNMIAPFIAALLWAGLVWLACVVATGAWGITPGKWLFGIRVVRTTLRRCNFIHALMRELLLPVDVPLLLSVLPGVLCMVATENRRRIGDVLADTLVIVARRPAENRG